MRFAWMALLGLLLLVPAAIASAQPYDVPPTWGGDLWSRPRLSGSWFGVRDELGKKGVVFDVDLLLTPQSVMMGGHDTGSEFWGKRRLHAQCRYRQARALAGWFPEGDRRQWIWSQRAPRVRGDRAGEHAGHRAGARRADHGAHERDVVAVSQHQVRPDGRQGLYARRFPGRVCRQLPHTVLEHRAGVPDVDGSRADLGLRRRDHRASVRERPHVGAGARSQRHADRQRLD
jgi:hypothetical protein